MSQTHMLGFMYTIAWQSRRVHGLINDELVEDQLAGKGLMGNGIAGRGSAENGLAEG